MTEKKSAAEKMFGSEANDDDNRVVISKTYKTIAVLLAAAFFALYIEIKNISSSSKAVIMFPGSEETAEITNTKASDRYVMMAMEFFSSSYLAVTPATVEGEHSNILRFTHPSTYPALQKRLAEDAAKIKEMKTVSMVGDVNWGAGVSSIILKEHAYKVSGTVHRVRWQVSRSIYTSNDTSRDARKVFMDYIIENGRFYLLELAVEG